MSGDDLRAVRPTADGDPADVLARVAWSALAEPGDATAGSLVEALGADGALRLVRSAAGERTPTDAADRLVRGIERGDEGSPRDLVGVALDEDEHRRARRALAKGLERWRPRLESLDVLRILQTAAAVGGRLLVPSDPGWPDGLHDLGPHAPFALWTRSRTDIAIGGPGLAVVGSRANTTYGTEVAAELAAAAAGAGLQVVSGGAYGIDAVAHRVTIGAGGPTIAVLAGGVDQLYPAGHADLLRGVMQRGAVLAESPPGVRPTRWRFLARNRLIAALTSAVVVVEAGARSGALNTAHHAAQLGRPVLAVPGPITSAASVGTHRLIAQGRAEVLVTVQDAIAAATDGPGPGGSATVLGGTNDDPELVRALDALDRRRALPTAEIARRSGLSMSEATDALALAELQGRVIRSVGGWSCPDGATTRG